jgi:hypothetical protein
VSEKIDLDELERKAKAATPGPWQWYGNSKMHSVYLATVGGGRVFVMDFERWGMTGAQPRFQVDQRMVRLGELAKSEHPLGPKFEVPYRRDFAGIGHPDAAHIAANDPTTTLALIVRIRELEIALGEACGDMPGGSQHDRLYDVLARGVTP